MSTPTYSAFGDESGSLDNVLKGNEDVFVAAVVAGPHVDCLACPERSVRRDKSLDEAKWNEFVEVQKRRFVDCITDRSDKLQLVHAVVTEEKLLELENSYLLFQPDKLPIRWNLFVLGEIYAALLDELQKSISVSPFVFDRIYGKNQSDKVTQTITEYHGKLGVSHEISHRSKGVQAADCYAGAVSDRVREKGTWLDDLPSSIVSDASGYALARLEKALYDVTK